MQFSHIPPSDWSLNNKSMNERQLSFSSKLKYEQCAPVDSFVTRRSIVFFYFIMNHSRVKIRVDFPQYRKSIEELPKEFM